MEMLEIAGQQEMARVQGYRGDRYIGNPWMLSVRDGFIRHAARQPCRGRIKGNYSLATTGDQSVEPSIQPEGPFDTALAAQLAYSLGQFSHFYARHE